jgi:hypothetical protein
MIACPLLLHSIFFNALTHNRPVQIEKTAFNVEQIRICQNGNQILKMTIPAVAGIEILYFICLLDNCFQNHVEELPVQPNFQWLLAC